MVSPEKYSNALRALNAVLVLARGWAYEGKGSELATVLDVAEYLPLLLLDSADRTDAFREQLAGLATQWPSFVLALERFDETRLE